MGMHGGSMTFVRGWPGRVSLHAVALDLGSDVDANEIEMVGLAAVHPVQACELGESPVAGVDEHGRPAGGGGCRGKGSRDGLR